MVIQTQDGRVFVGTPLQIVQEMRSASTVPAMTILSYVDFVARNANEFDVAGMATPPDGLSDEELAKWLIEQLVATGLARLS